MIKNLKPTNKRIENIANSFRLLGWAQGVILPTISGVKLNSNYLACSIVAILWFICLFVAYVLDGTFIKDRKND